MRDFMHEDTEAINFIGRRDRVGVQPKCIEIGRIDIDHEIGG